MNMSAKPGQWTFTTAIVLSVSSAFVAFVSVCAYLLDQTGCGADIVSTNMWASYSWLALATGSTTLLSLIVTYDNECAGPLTIKVTSALSIVMLAALSVLSGLITADAWKNCKGDSKNGLFGMSLAVCIASSLGVLLWIGTIVRGENFGKKFDGIAPRYRRARQFA